MIINGSFNPFTGPIYDQNKLLRVKKDEFATRDQIIGMDWFVDVVESKLPKVSKE
jgi:hypothetical protein